MTKAEKFCTLEDELLLLQHTARGKTLSMAEIFQALSGKGRSLVLILLSLPFCQPIQIPGLSTPFGLAIAFIGLRMVFGKRIWLPRRFLNKNVPPHTLNKAASTTLNLVRKAKPWIHSRLIPLCHSPSMKKGNGFIIFVLGLLLSLPLPVPLSNITAAWSILLMALGMLEDDGLLILMGYLAALLTGAFFLALALAVNTIF